MEAQRGQNPIYFSTQSLKMLNRELEASRQQGLEVCGQKRKLVEGFCICVL